MDWYRIRQKHADLFQLRMTMQTHSSTVSIISEKVNTWPFESHHDITFTFNIRFLITAQSKRAFMIHTQIVIRNSRRKKLKYLPTEQILRMRDPPPLTSPCMASIPFLISSPLKHRPLLYHNFRAIHHNITSLRKYIIYLKCFCVIEVKHIYLGLLAIIILRELYESNTRCQKFFSFIQNAQKTELHIHIEYVYQVIVGVDIQVQQLYATHGHIQNYTILIIRLNRKQNTTHLFIF